MPDRSTDNPFAFAFPDRECVADVHVNFRRLTYLLSDPGDQRWGIGFPGERRKGESVAVTQEDGERVLSIIAAAVARATPGQTGIVCNYARQK